MNFSSSLKLAVLAILALALSPKSYGSPIGWGKCDMEIKGIIHRYVYYYTIGATNSKVV